VSALREQVLAALAKFQPQAVDVPGMGGTLYVRPLTVAGMCRVHDAQAKDPGRMPTLMLIDCLVDEKGEQIFSEGDEPTVAAFPGHLADKLVTAIQKVSHLADTGTKEATGN
jgi:hypothetical protein